MRVLDPELAAHLAGGATTLCACWRIDRPDGRSLGFTDHDGALDFDGVVFAPEAAVGASAVESATGLAADNVEIMGALRSDAVTSEDVARGAYDGAAVRRWTVNWRAPEQRLLTFSGVLGRIEQEDGAFRAEALGAAAMLNRPLGRVFQAACDAEFGDARCGVDAEAQAWRGEGHVVALAADGAFEASGLAAHLAGWFQRGRLRWTGGVNAGLSAVLRMDRSAGAARLLALREAPFAPIAPGDAFVVTAGCDKMAETCRSKFGNFLNFRGFPDMPGEDWLTAGVVAGAVKDGGARGG